MEHVIIFVYTNAVTSYAMLQLYVLHDFCNNIFKIK
jgi:hypothetical protein